ncbi:MAG: aminotransferase class V-fold PLP-dependent enzyme [Pirellulales bacterium]
MSIYDQFGLQPIINASGAVTRLGGAPMPDAVLDAFRAAAVDSVPLDLLQGAASRIIAEATGTEAALVTAGAAAALTLGAAAILSGGDPGRMERLPNCEGFPCEFVVAREHRNGYDHAVRAAGARLVEVGFHESASGAGMRRVEAWEYEAAFGPRTAGVLYVLTDGSRPPLADVVARAHANHLPVLVDAAGELPPRANLQKIPASGADLVVFSGGKAIRGPQATGILCGRRALVGAAALQMLDIDEHADLWQPPLELIDREALLGMPRQGIGRAMKVSKEQIVALVTALRLFVRGDYDAELAGYTRRLQSIADALAGAAARCTLHTANGERMPMLEIAVDETKLGRSAIEVCRRLRAGSPPCYVGHWALDEGQLLLNPLHLNDERTRELARRLREELTP